MRGLFLEQGTVRFRTDLQEPVRTPGESRVRVLRTGVCATDLALARGYMSFRGVPGHEFVGVALEGPHAGQRVVGEINAGCGRCPACRSGRAADRRHCPARSVLGILHRPGAFAEMLRLPDENLRLVPDALPTDRAVFTEPLAAAFEIPAQLELADFDRMLVLGDGRLGLLCAQVLAAGGRAVDLVGRHPDRGDWLPATVHHRGELAGERPRRDERYSLVVEATGDPALFQRALTLVAPRGTLVLKTTSEAPAALDLAPLVVDEIRVLGSRCGPFAPAVDALTSGVVRVEPMIHARYPLEEGPRAFEHAGRAGTLKVLVDVDGSPT